MSSASLARGLSEETKSRVSSGSISFSRNLPSSILNGLANLCDRLIKFFMSFLFMRSLAIRHCWTSWHTIQSAT